ncbi:DNA-binding transcriptional regulator, LysR family [Methylobacterium sp. 275MFSha3.1]|uniref:LysR family transcriptional regulator n=1 Tax=Methylobacterium sp. 275MFSha3.1 TaxID=1502746 RepID=UPI0008A7FC2E|nr:LysR family transcriptional regulator [Methylobacterium sp. 275MFSha3.1]SEH94585.1 DNA-binding transcriptional regulator, LysR family [Methylobacterium sp. 275MFSha3.1]
MNSIDLMFFAAVAETGGIGRAAARLNTVQSNVTGRIRALEQALRVPLFHRGSRGVTLTRAGERLLPYALQVGQLLAEARHALLAEGEPRGPLRIGAMETTAALRLPGPLADFAARHPDVDIELETGPTEHLIARVLDRSLEGAFVAGPVAQADLVGLPVFTEELVLVAQAAVGDLAALLDRLARARNAKVLVFRAGCSYRRRLEAFLARQGLVHVRRMEFGTLDGILGCVAAGLGVTLVPRAVAAPAHRAGRVSIHPVPDGDGHAPTLVVHRADDRPSAAFARFAEQVRTALPDVT